MLHHNGDITFDPQPIRHLARHDISGQLSWIIKTNMLTTPSANRDDRSGLWLAVSKIKTDAQLRIAGRGIQHAQRFVTDIPGLARLTGWRQIGVRNSPGAGTQSARTQCWLGLDLRFFAHNPRCQQHTARQCRAVWVVCLRTTQGGQRLATYSGLRLGGGAGTVKADFAPAFSAGVHAIQHLLHHQPGVAVAEVVFAIATDVDEMAHF